MTLHPFNAAVANGSADVVIVEATFARPHAEGPPLEGDLADGVVTGPWHATPFNVKAGEAGEGGVADDPVATCDVCIEGNNIQIAKPQASHSILPAGALNGV